MTRASFKKYAAEQMPFRQNWLEKVGYTADPGSVCLLPDEADARAAEAHAVETAQQVIAVRARAEARAELPRQGVTRESRQTFELGRGNSAA